MTSTDI